MDSETSPAMDPPICHRMQGNSFYNSAQAVQTLSTAIIVSREELGNVLVVLATQPIP